MKKIVVGLLMISFVGLTAIAQPSYPPAPAPKGNIIKAEYFFDTEPGLGNGTGIAIGPSTDLANLNLVLSLGAITKGGHRLYIRTMDIYGKWSHASTLTFDNFVSLPYPAAPAAAGLINKMEYFIDTDPGIGNGIDIPVSATADTGPVNLMANVTGLTKAVHRLYVRSRDNQGKWSITNYAVFENTTSVPYPSAPPAAPPVGQLEYYFDTDPGFGNGTAVSVTPGTDIVNFTFNASLGSITTGQHTVYIRSRQNPWSFSAYSEFTVGGTLPLNWLYVKGEMKNAKALLNWAVAQQENTKDFIIEHSADGATFTAVGVVEAAGSNAGTMYYSFEHAHPLTGMNYYRIKQTDLDGHFTMSKTIQLLNTNNQRETLIAPNPVKDQLYVIEPAETVIRKMEVYDMSGRLLQQSIPATQQGRQFSISLGHLQRGNYLLKVYYKGSFKTFKLKKD
jgi:hypothetical protein